MCLVLVELGVGLVENEVVAIKEGSKKMAPRAGLEPATNGLTVRCSTN